MFLTKKFSGCVCFKEIWQYEYLENLQGRLIRIYLEMDREAFGKEVGGIYSFLILKKETRGKEVWFKNNGLAIFNKAAKTFQ